MLYVYAKQLIADIPDESLTVFDRGFLSVEILCALINGGKERHFIIPAKSNSRWELVAGDETDDVVRMRVSPQARAKCAQFRILGDACRHDCRYAGAKTRVTDFAA